VNPVVPLCLQAILCAWTAAGFARHGDWPHVVAWGCGVVSHLAFAWYAGHLR
jgi:hypothetical protein